MDIVIETPRLRLRPHRLADFPAMLALWQQPEVVRHTLGRPITEEEAWHRLTRYAGHWALLGHGMFAVEARSDGALAGEVGIMDFRRGLGPAFDGSPEAGWMLGAAHQRQGLAQEALAALFDWFGQRLGPRTVCIIRADHAASLVLAGRLGFHPFADAEYKGHPAVLHERIVSSAAETR